MIYTIGHTPTFLKGIERRDSGETKSFDRAGKSESYVGGIVFNTEDDAIKFLTDDIEDYKETYRDKDYSVFRVDADWNKDCYKLEIFEHKYWKYLKRDRPIISLA